MNVYAAEEGHKFRVIDGYQLAGHKTGRPLSAHQRGLSGYSYTADVGGGHQHLVGQFQQLIEEVWQLIWRLDQGGVRDFEFASELRALQAAYAQLGHLQLTLHLHPAAIEVLTKEEERTLLSIVREALSVCVHHAKATQAAVSLRKRGAKVLLRIRDNGTCGMPGNDQLRGAGWPLVDACARKIGGKVRIQSTETRGTQVQVEFSLEPFLAPV